MEQHLQAPSLQVKIARVDADRFGHAGAGSRQEEQESPIAPAAGCRPIWGGDDGIDLGVGEVMRHLDVRPLGGDCQNALGDAEGGGIHAIRWSFRPKFGKSRIRSFGLSSV